MTKYSNSLQASNLEVKESLENLGQRLRANRIVLGWTSKDTAARLLCSQNTYRAIEAGRPTASIGIIANALWLFGQIDSLNRLAPVPLNIRGVKRVRNPNKNPGNTLISKSELDF
ncbi:MAG: helix-turn-helix domain-containing protein [Polynucleobacter sp.]|jgi:transcriptional regulator with XRE-family HTH domain|nr:helix-turn-helix domain-containing protein [Polynucleobacter sp.]